MIKDWLLTFEGILITILGFEIFAFALLLNVYQGIGIGNFLAATLIILIMLTGIVICTGGIMLTYAFYQQASGWVQI